ncbi:Alpha/Beta hydrolase protein [Aspergillus granulosus]|uniref:Alpha/Beta hydrolase protein n=1 Tax=Aspergillus granulosus TaxID=176169 RepID=A0ABR4GRE9_9EURO
MTATEKINFPSSGIKAAGILFPPNYSPQAKYPAIVIAHPMTAAKEQSPSLYALTLAPAGYIVLTYDAVYQGESEGQPRYLEDPNQRAEDVRAARLGALGICASGGYVPYAAQTDLRIKAVATVSAVCTGRMTRDGLMPGLGGPEAGEEAPVNPSLPPTVDVVPTEAPADIKTLADYKTPRGQHERAPGIFATRSASLLGNFDAFAFNNLISPRPLLMIAGEDAGTKFYSEIGVSAAKQPKELLIVPGRDHAALYDN